MSSQQEFKSTSRTREIKQFYGKTRKKITDAKDLKQNVNLIEKGHLRNLFINMQKAIDKKHKKDRKLQEFDRGDRRPYLRNRVSGFQYRFQENESDLRAKIAYIDDNGELDTIISLNDIPFVLSYRTVIVAKNGLVTWTQFEESLNHLFGSSHSIVFLKNLKLASIENMTEIDIKVLIDSGIQTISFAEDDTGVRTTGHKIQRQVNDLFVESNVTRQSTSYALGRITKNGSLGNSPWTIETANSGSGVTCFVVDSGFNRNHPDIAGKATRGKSFISGSQWYDDTIGHGTAVASLICGEQSGIALDVNIVPYKVFGSNGETSNTIILSAFDNILGTETPLGGKIINCSFGGPHESSINLAIKSLHDAGATVVVAAGNEGSSASNFSPANSDYAVTVGATTASSFVASFSNYGPAVDIWAPGQSVEAAVSASSIGPVNGTSFSCPLVSGCVAIVLNIYPGIIPIQVKTALLNASEKSLVTGQSNNYLAYIGPNAEDLAFGDNPYFAYNPPLGETGGNTPPPIGETGDGSIPDTGVDYPDDSTSSALNIGLIVTGVAIGVIILGFVLYRVFNPRKKAMEIRTTEEAVVEKSLEQ